MGIISTRMPLVAAQEGVWEGEYVHLAGGELGR
jgi:hypothetical protein